ncbi:hypothetical protein VNI00_010325 [Paramarasmius palmivorus]|uniref:Uncharacterized protein n=1 Tax=Paramarasmius palmivorus TaxID=297713 RepID=A0AAW0CJE2_9AGAR
MATSNPHSPSAEMSASSAEMSASKARDRPSKITMQKGRKGQPRTKACLFFPVDDEPEIITLSQRQINAFDFRPYMDSTGHENGGPCRIEGARIERGNISENYTFYYFQQTQTNGFDVNDCVTRELEALTDGLRRPWYGPILVVGDAEDFINEENLELQGESIVIDISNFYEGVVRDDSIEFDSLEDEEEENSDHN